MCCYVRLDQFIPVLLAFVVLGLVFFSTKPRLAGKNVSEKMTYSVWSGT